MTTPEGFQEGIPEGFPKPIQESVSEWVRTATATTPTPSNVTSTHQQRNVTHNINERPQDAQECLRNPGPSSHRNGPPAADAARGLGRPRASRGGYSWEPTYVIDRTVDLEAICWIHDESDDPSPWRRDGARTELSIIEPIRSDDDPARWRVVRSGERDEILWPVRRAVAQRDDFCCRWCRSSDWSKLQADHIVPWSAGGSDRSTNLRLLCERCNQERSNRVDLSGERESMPVTWWCVRCWGPDADERLPWYSGEAWENGANSDWLNISHRVYRDQGIVTAYCAECRHVSATDVTL